MVERSAPTVPSLAAVAFTARQKVCFGRLSRAAALQTEKRAAPRSGRAPVPRTIESLVPAETDDRTNNAVSARLNSFDLTAAAPALEVARQARGLLAVPVRAFK